MNDRQLRYAHAVWKEHSFSKASHRLNVSQPSLSDQVRLLEDEIGFELFERSNRGVHPTLPGRTFLKEVDRVVQHLADLKGFVVQLNGKPGMQLRIGIAAGLAETISVPIITRLRTEAPHLRPSLVVASPRRIARLIENDRIDIGIAVRGLGDQVPRTIQTQPIAQVPLVALSPRTGKGPVSLEELAATPLIVNDAVVGFGASLSALFRDTEMVPKIIAHCDDLGGVVAMVAAGLGMSVVPHVLLAGRTCASSEVVLRSIEKSIMLSIELVRGIEPLSPRLEAQIEPTVALIRSLVTGLETDR